MSLTPITEGLPSDLSNQLMNQETVLYFSYIAFKGGCGSSASRSNYWISLTDKRVLYKAKISEENNKNVFVERDGMLPLEKVSFMEVSEKSQQGCGCSTAKSFQLRIGTSGGTVIVPIPTKEKCQEIIRTYSEITQSK